MPRECNEKLSPPARQAFNTLGGEDTSRPTLTLELERYANHFEDSGIDEHDQKVLMEQIWAIIVAVVDIGWSVDKADPFLAEVFAAGGSDMHNEKVIPNKNNKKGGVNE